MSGPGPDVTAVLVVFLVPLAASLGPLLSKAFLSSAPGGGRAARIVPASFLLAGLLAPAAALVRLYPVIAGGGTVGFALGRVISLWDVPALREALAQAGALTALAGGLFAIAQTDAKRLLAWSSVGHAGLCLAAFASGSFAAGALHALAHGAAKALLFLSVGRAADAAESLDLERLRGRAGLGPSLGILVGFASLAGLPPLAGWVSKSLAGFSAGGGPAGLVLSAASVLSAAALFRLFPILGVFGPRSSRAIGASGTVEPGSEVRHSAAGDTGRIREAAVFFLGLSPLVVLYGAGSLPRVLEAALALASPGAPALSLPAFGLPALLKVLPTLGAAAALAAVAGTRLGRRILGLWERKGTGADAALRLLLAGAAASALLGLL